ncbi:MAG TPA: GNAT family N-acetyltransferase [Longimicrobiales bacterium]|nr:GNAT family N-acetyltransferase [Longimicrobiales bacterium]
MIQPAQSGSAPSDDPPTEVTLIVSIHSLPDPTGVQALKTRYLEGLLAPLDGMWDTGFIAPAPHFELRLDDRRAGYCVIDEAGTLIQFFMEAGSRVHGKALLEAVLHDHSVAQAIAFTLDPWFLSLCLDRQSSVKTHSYLYELPSSATGGEADLRGATLRLLDGPELRRVVEFQQSCVHGGTSLTDWLLGYSSQLIGRRELYVLGDGDDWIGLGECRRSDTQPGVADLGMMVAPARRRRGWGTAILRRLCALCGAQGLRPICSTTVENIGAQRAIEDAGFVSRHRIVDIRF